MSALNPYKNFKIDPFEIARQTDMVGAWFEAFKKIACAGIEGRAKDTLTDLKEASFTVSRIITDLEDGKHYAIHRPELSLKFILDMYSNDTNKDALYHFLNAYYHPSDMHHLYSCRLAIDKLIN